LPANGCGIFRGKVRQHGDERRIDLHVVEYDFVVRVAVGVPRVCIVVPLTRANTKPGGTAADKWCLIAAPIERVTREPIRG
jgi:hypothetical protein